QHWRHFPFLTSNGYRNDLASKSSDGAVAGVVRLAPLPAAGKWREGDTVSVLLDQDQPEGVHMRWFHNGFAIGDAELRGLKLTGPHAHHLRLAVSTKGVGTTIALSDTNVVDRCAISWPALSGATTQNTQPSEGLEEHQLPSLDALPDLSSLS